MLLYQKAKDNMFDFYSIGSKGTGANVVGTKVSPPSGRKKEWTSLRPPLQISYPDSKPTFLFFQNRTFFNIFLSLFPFLSPRKKIYILQK
jgi:hypothetical protein